MGVVWLAEREHAGFRQRVALKQLHAGTRSAVAERRFRREWQVLARLEHPHIARLIDAGIDADGRAWLAVPVALLIVAVGFAIFRSRASSKLANSKSAPTTMVEAAKGAGVPEDVLKQARGAHDTAHILWEWWTAENSDGFLNPAAARESLTQSITASQEGVALLDKAIADARARR